MFCSGVALMAGLVVCWVLFCGHSGALVCRGMLKDTCFDGLLRFVTASRADAEVSFRILNSMMPHLSDVAYDRRILRLIVSSMM